MKRGQDIRTEYEIHQLNFINMQTADYRNQNVKSNPIDLIHSCFVYNFLVSLEESSIISRIYGLVDRSVSLFL